MSQYRTDNPELVEQKSVGNDGRIYVGTDLAGEDVEICLTRTNEQEDAETPEDADA
jgi:hypothetical protein